jgi:hypothetical protein
MWLMMLCACMSYALLHWFFEWALHSKQMVQYIIKILDSGSFRVANSVNGPLCDTKECQRTTNFRWTLVYKFVRLQMTRDKFISIRFWVILGHSGKFQGFLFAVWDNFGQSTLIGWQQTHQGGGKPLHVKTTMHGVYVICHVVFLLTCESFWFDIGSKIWKRVCDLKSSADRAPSQNDSTLNL